MDYRVYRAINQFVLHHAWLGRDLATLENWAVPAVALAAFGIAFAVFLFDRVAGTVFLAAAVIVGAGRVLIGAHYPADVLAGCLVGLGCALLVARVANPVIRWLVRLVERVTDPLLAPSGVATPPTHRSGV